MKQPKLIAEFKAKKFWVFKSVINDIICIERIKQNKVK